MNATLRIRNLEKRFGGIVVANGIDLDLNAGRILGLIGPNGAGKTTLFNLITGVVRADSGRIELRGEAIDRLPIHQRARRGLARTWQNLRLFPSLSVLDNLLLGSRDYAGESLWRLAFEGRAIGRRESSERDRALQVLERVGLASARDERVEDLPYGQQKLVSVARALMNEAQCLLLDEPMAGVEGAAYGAIQRVVREIAESGVAVCVVEHNVAFVRDLCDEAVFMFAGKVMARGTLGELMADPRLTELYFGT